MVLATLSDLIFEVVSKYEKDLGLNVVHSVMVSFLDAPKAKPAG